MSVLKFNVEALPEAQNFDVLPVGVYTVQIEKCEATPTKDATGIYLNLQMRVHSGDFANRIIFSMINIKNNSDRAVQIGLGQLRQLALACDIHAITDTDNFINKIVDVKVKIQAAKDGYDAKNVVSSYLKSADAVSSMPSTFPMAPKPEAPKMAPKPEVLPPWAK